MTIIASATDAKPQKTMCEKLKVKPLYKGPCNTSHAKFNKKESRNMIKINCWKNILSDNFFNKII